VVENRKLLIALAVVLLGGIVARFLLVEIPLSDEPYYVGVPDETPGFRALEVYVCPKCRDAIYEVAKNRATGPEATEVLSTFRLFYDKPGENGRCPNHPDQVLIKTTQIPVAPQVKFGLPDDTDFISRVYLPKGADPEKPFAPIDVVIVISSKTRRSIHRAESCLASQAWRMQSQGTVKLNCEGAPGGTISVRSLLMSKKVRAQDGELVQVQLVVLYWYAALPDRVMSSEYKRLATMFYDRLIRGKNYRWSYVLVSRQFGPGANVPAISKELQEFVTEFAALARRGRLPQ
jgi:hypothetical protein